MTFVVTAVPALVAVWLAASPGPAAPPAPARASVAWTARGGERPERSIEPGRPDTRGDALGALGPDADEGDPPSSLHACGRAAFDSVPPLPSPAARRPVGTPHATPHYLIASRLNC